MLDVGAVTPPNLTSAESAKAAPVAAPSKGVLKAGAIVILTPTALKLSRELQSIQTDPEKDPEARLEAHDQLRKMALQILNGG